MGLLRDHHPDARTPISPAGPLRENFVAITGRATARTDEPLTLATLAASQAFIRYSATSTAGMRVERLLRYNNIDPHRKLEVDHADTLTLLVSQGLGWAITTPTCLLQTGTRFVDVIDLIPVEQGNSTRPIFLITRRGEFPMLANAFVGKVREALTSLLATQPRLRVYVPEGAIDFSEPRS